MRYLIQYIESEAISRQINISQQNMIQEYKDHSASVVFFFSILYKYMRNIVNIFIEFYPLHKLSVSSFMTLLIPRL